MPFDPKLIREEDANFEGDLQLPDDLALMAQQLGDDAARLAACYPPPAPKTLMVSRPDKLEKEVPSRRKAWLSRSLAGTALAVGLVTISLVASNFYSPSEADRPLPAGAPLPAMNSLVMHEAPAPKGTEPQKIPVTPASYLGDASGPELEALMDLWEQDQPKVRSLSF